MKRTDINMSGTKGQSRPKKWFGDGCDWKRIVCVCVFVCSKRKKKQEEREWRLPGLFFKDDLVLCGESKEDLRTMVGWFVEVCRRRGLKVNAGKSEVMVLNKEELLKCDVHVGGIRLEQCFSNIFVPTPPWDTI